MSQMLDTLMQEKIVAIFRNIEDRYADQAAEALLAGGITLMEITMNTKGAPAMISRWRDKYGDQAGIGAGTVLDLQMAKEAVAAGAQFLISPNLDEAVIEYGIRSGVSVWPGVMTPTEIVKAWKAGAEAVKVFPMGTLGWKYLAEIKAPLDKIPMMATGGVDLDNIGDYFKAGACAVGMGSKLVNMEWVREGRFDLLTERARKFADAVKSL
ncbi:bifunctional 4-hydroxy-2-oxoglutarate aldolase/2-dehydro-3-deoxy-phosphogluconate aldolase [Paenibacillus nasutitermitis]|uniref:Bifunctional 2-keto-4-hydroxyglutarate aldolase/2-keto-3-deoxy-6-phosphogluconate aldolase n=1 Tax=Paenibacillus nasutitermitis TaxID=1652958 RepID=A0A916YJ07_9BACL|nr:bifunctional 4-hydroxy-2-oxoglutarate aldolase/2-dehydro-3-deoxy-phosphogluconate aldolase [Paenibacillus nasutitermitis]GGD47241.1 bifunctional 2-keto-4-hydroxyglutarate aldolase/2-keto-3-deoxy-6-phosphogluconate aldolase [Paenibacillus nasutitermitis]